MLYGVFGIAVVCLSIARLPFDSRIFVFSFPSNSVLADYELWP